MCAILAITRPVGGETFATDFPLQRLWHFAADPALQWKNVPLQRKGVVTATDSHDTS